MNTKKGKLLIQWLSSVLVILLVVSAISIPFKKNGGFGGSSSSSGNSSEDTKIEDGIYLDKKEIIF